MGYLRHLLNGKTVSLYELGESQVIGRRADCNIAIDDPTVSATHARLQLQPSGAYMLSDMDSTNGVLIGGKKVTEVELKPNDVFSIGTHDFEYLEKMPQGLETTVKIKKSWIPGVYYTE